MYQFLDKKKFELLIPTKKKSRKIFKLSFHENHFKKKIYKCSLGIKKKIFGKDKKKFGMKNFDK